MSESDLYDSLQIAYEFVEQAERLANNREYEAANIALQKAASYAYNNATLLDDIQQRRQALTEARQRYINQLETEATALFDREQFNDRQARQILQALLNQDEQNELARSLWAELPVKEAAERERRLIEEVQQGLEQIWQRAREFEDVGAGSRAVAEYERALTEISKKAGDAPHVIPLQRLKLTAAEKRDQAKDKWVGTPTLILARKGQELVDRYEAIKQRGETETEFFDENGEYLGCLPIDECIDRAKKLASRFAEQKAQDYLGQARELLAESPGAAYAKIQDALSLAYPSDFARSILEKELKEKIEPAMQRREQAVSQVKAALNKENPVEVWLALDAAEALDRFTPELADTRQRLLPTLTQEATGLLEAGQRFQELEDFAAAQDRFQRAVDIGQMIFARDQEFQDLYAQSQAALEQCVQAEKEVQQFDERLANIARQSQTDPDQAKEQLANLLTPNLSRHAIAKIERLRVQIDFKLGVDQIFHTLEEKMLAATEAAELIPIEEAAIQATQDYSGEERLPRLIERIMARRLFLEASRFCGNPEQYLAARENFQQVIALRGDDAAAAQSLLDEIAVDEQQETDIALALQEAQTALENGDARSAYLLLEPYRQAISRQLPQIRAAISQAASQWRNELDEQLENLVAAGDFSLPRVEALLHALERCQSPRLAEWRSRALAQAYAKTASDLQELSRWDRAGDLWEAAFKLAPADPRIVEGRRNARKHQDLIRAQMTFDPAGKEQRLNELNRLYNDDPTLKRYLAEFYYTEGRYVEARMAIAQTRFLAEHLATALSKTDADAIRRIETLIEAAERIEKQKFAIRSQLTGQTTISELRQARQAFETLREDAPDQAEKLQEWWSDLVKETVNQMKAEVAQLAESGGTILARAELLCKILALQTDADIQEQAERMLKLTYHRLPAEVQEVVGNLEASGYGPPDQALKNHIGRAKELHKRLVNLSQVERNATDLGVRLGERTLNLNNALYELELILEKLYFAREKQLEIKNQVVVAMMTGHWETIEDSFQELEQRGLAQHRGLKELPKEIETAKRQRADLETAVAQIKEAMAQENFQIVQDRLIYMHTQDPADESQLLAGLEVIDPYTGLTIRGYRALVGVITEKLTVMQMLNKWQASCRPAVDWEAVRAKMTEWANSGDFAPAIELGRAVTSDNDKHQEVFQDGTWSLGHVLQYLETPPLTLEQINNSHAEATFNQARQKAQLLHNQYQECDRLIQELQQKEQEFRQILDNLKPLLNQVHQSRDLLSTILSPSGETQEIKQQIVNLIRRGRQLCPAYPVFVNFDESSLLRR
ncbi:MAG: hypothetical protein JW953_14500 [Anaerolineae bacterium]|nr:hypothetical protein [Anaerolineae bacterium]